MREFRYQGRRFRQPLRSILSFFYTIIYPFTHRRSHRKHRRLKRPIRNALSLASAIAMFLAAIPVTAYMLVPTPVHADDEETLRIILKMEGKTSKDVKDIKQQAIIQKAVEEKKDISTIDTAKSVVAASCPAPVTKPTLDNMHFSTVLVEKSADTVQETTAADGSISPDGSTADTENIQDVSSDAAAQSENDSSAFDATDGVLSPLPNVAAADANDITAGNSSDGTAAAASSDGSSDISSQTADLAADKNVTILADDTDPDDTAADTKTPVVHVKADEVTVNNGDDFYPQSLITWIETDSNLLPVLQTESNVDTSTDGQYSVTYKVVNQSGKSDSKTVIVDVVTHPEQIETEEKAEEEAKEAEKENHIEAVKAAGGLLTAERDDRKAGTSYNPYPGYNYNNCTWGAWQLAYEKLGVTLPHWGNAGYWLKRAQADGYATGTIPMPNSIMVSAGHVAFVSEVSEDGKSVFVQQGNYTSPYSSRPFSGYYTEFWNNAYGYLKSGKKIYGYIYLE